MDGVTRRDLGRAAPAVAAAALAGGGSATAAESPPRRQPAEFLRFAAEDRVGLNALLWTPARPTRSAVVLIPGFNGSILGGAHDYQPLAEALTARGYAFLLPAMRTASDFSDPRFEDCEQDIGAAVAAAKARGLTEIALFGTSLGGPRAFYFLSRREEPAVRAMGTIASIMSPYEEAQLRFAPEDRARLDAMLARCRSLVAEGRAEEPVRFVDWFPRRHVMMTARGFLNVFGAPSDTALSSYRYGASVRVPALVVHGTADEVALPPNVRAIHDSLTAAPSRELVWVECATHYLQPGWIAQRYAEIVADWVSRTMPAAS
jgi:pimeloyl-ACP methyl ester carboxylesterase